MKRRRARAWLRWMLLALTAASAAILIGSCFQRWNFNQVDPRGTQTVTFNRGVIAIGFKSGAQPSVPSSDQERQRRERQSAAYRSVETATDHGSAWPRWGSLDGSWGVVAPLWLPTVALGALALWCWWPAGQAARPKRSSQGLSGSGGPISSGG